ncbi:poliovirus receptor-related protein 2 [Sarotherodon galilaeus]
MFTDKILTCNSYNQAGPVSLISGRQRKFQKTIKKIQHVLKSIFLSHHMLLLMEMMTCGRTSMTISLSNTPTSQLFIQLSQTGHAKQNVDIFIMSKRRLLIFSFLLLWVSGLTDGGEVKQTAMLWKNQGDNVSIECSHTYGSGYYQMYWYRQLPGELMKQMVFTTPSTKPDFEPDFRDEKFSATKRDADSGTLIVTNLVPGDQGLYFCAVSMHSDTATLNTRTKTSDHEL